MHELSMAQGIINAVIDTAESNNATEVTEVGIEIGRLAMIPVEINCPECGFKGVAELDDKDHYAPIVECPKCGNKRISILNGKDCVVKNIVIEKPDDD